MNEINHELDLLRCIVSDPSQVDEIRFVASRFDFLDPQFAEAYDALVSLHEGGRPINDARVLLPALRDLGFPPADVTRILADIFREWVQAKHARYYAEEVRRAADLRRLRQLADDFSRAADDPRATPAELMRSIDAKLLVIRESVTNSACEVVTLEEAAGGVVDAIRAEIKQASLPGTMTGLSTIDTGIGSLRCGELVILAARPGVGKTALAMQIAVHTARRHRPAFFVSLEMTSRELAQRELCRLAEVDNRKLRRGDGDDYDVEKLTAVLPETKDLPFHLWAPPVATLSQIRAMARIQNMATPLRLLVVDYLQLIKADDRRAQRYEQVSQISAGLKVLAKELSIPVLALCQLNREAEKASPQLSHLRESGSIEQDADMVIFIDQDTPPEGDEWEVTIKVAKHRHGPTGKFKLLWNPRATQFRDKADAPARRDPEPRDFGGWNNG